MKVKEIPESAVLVQDSQDRRHVLESLGLLHLYEYYPTLFVEVENGGYRRVWGVETFVPYIEAEAHLLWEE